MNLTQLCQSAKSLLRNGISNFTIFRVFRRTCQLSFGWKHTGFESQNPITRDSFPIVKGIWTDYGTVPRPQRQMRRRQWI